MYRKGGTDSRVCCYQSHAVLDESGYIAIPPCLWGDPAEGLVRSLYLYCIVAGCMVLM